MADIQTLSDSEIRAMIAQERRFKPVAEYERDEGTNLLEGGARVLTRITVGGATLGLAGAGMAYIDDAMRENVRRALAELTFDELNAKNGLALSLSPEEAEELAQKGRREPGKAVLDGWLANLADVTIIGGIINAFGQQRYNKHEVEKEADVIRAAEARFLEKAAFETDIAATQTETARS